MDARLPIKSNKQTKVRLVVLDPGHFHAALVQKEMYAGLDPCVSVYAPLGPDLLDYLQRVSLFNNRDSDPTHWDLDIHTSADPLAAMLQRSSGNVLVLAGKNREKGKRILSSVSAGTHVLADKPWVIKSTDMGTLEEILVTAGHKGLIVYDIMTERYEVTSEIVRELVNTPDIFGQQQAGNPQRPGIVARSVHNVMKLVSGLPLRRPTSFFDIEGQGEGLADVGTHVVDLVQWTAFPDQVIDFRQDLAILSAKRWPLTMTKLQFQTVTGSTTFPASLAPYVHEDQFDYFCNNSVCYTIRGVCVQLEISWDWEGQDGSGDIYEAAFRGTHASVEIRQTSTERYRPEVYIVPVSPGQKASVLAALQHKVEQLQA